MQVLEFATSLLAKKENTFAAAASSLFYVFLVGARLDEISCRQCLSSERASLAVPHHCHVVE